jgi:hypothetical protein
MKKGKTNDLAEDMSERNIPMTMTDWEIRINEFLRFAANREVFSDNEKFNAEISKTHGKTKFEKYRVVKDHFFESGFDKIISALPRVKKKAMASRAK